MRCDGDQRRRRGAPQNGEPLAHWSLQKEETFQMPTKPFRIALSGDFRQRDGSPTYTDFDLAPLRAAPGVELAFLEPSNPLRPEQTADFDALILLTSAFTRQSIHSNGRLAIVSRFGVGYDAVDIPACTEAGIVVAITPDAVRRPVAVSIIAMLLALTGKLMVKSRLTAEGAEGFAKRRDHMGVGLVGRVLSSIGVGNIGAEMFRLAKPFDMKFIAHDPFAKPELAAELGVELVSLDDVFRRADFLTVNCPLSEETRRLVNAQRLALMKPTAYLINTARGPIVDQAALTQVLREGRIAGAGLDVLEVEPPDSRDPIFQLDNVIITPHALCWTDECFGATGRLAIEAVLDVMRGGAPRVPVNPAVLQSPRWRQRSEHLKSLTAA
jgi:phosphoglycerate dehydrogenase-like enzyme